MLSRLMLTVLLVCAAHFVVMITCWTPQAMLITGVLSFTTALIFILSSALGFPGIQKDGGNMVLRFLVMTTLQLLAEMSLIVILMLKFPEINQPIGISGVALFLLLLIIQSRMLIRGIRKKDQPN